MLGAGDDRWDGGGNMLRRPRPARTLADLSAQVSGELMLKRANTAALAGMSQTCVVTKAQSFVTPYTPAHHAISTVPAGGSCTAWPVNSLSQASQSASTLASQPEFPTV